MAYIKINSKYPLYDGMPITFKAPCDCTAAEGLTVNSTNFIFKDAHGNALTGIGNLFGKDALVKVILDKTNGFAYIQNADSNKYLETRMSAAKAGINANSANINTNRTNIATNKADIEVNRKNIASLASKVDRDDKRLTTIEAVVYGDLAQETEDNTVAYIKNVPSNARGTAKVNKLGGMTRKCTNLISFPFTDGSKTTNGITFTDNNDGSLIINGTAQADLSYALFIGNIPKGTYTMSVVNPIPRGTLYLYKPGLTNVDILTNNTQTVKTFTIDNDYQYLEFYLPNGATYNNFVLKPMLNSGDTALPYEPYFEGLRSAPVTEVESVGVNLFDISKLSGMDGLVVSGDKINITTASNNSGVTSASRLKDVAPQLKVGDIVTLTAITTGSDKYIYLEEALMAWYYGTPQTITEVMLNSRISFYASGVSTSATISEIMLNKGTTALPYTPYTRNTLPIPEAVRPKNGINESVHDYIEWCEDETRKSYKRVDVADLGTQEYIYSASQAYIPRFGAKPNGACLANVPSTIISYRFDSTGDPIFYFNEGAYGSAEEIKAAMSGVMLVYELATPEVTDISDILPADNYIGVEGGGTLTFKNEYEYDVPSEVTYITKGATV